MKDFYRDHGLEVLCGLLGKSRQAFYDHRWRQDRQALNAALVLDLVRQQRAETPGIGGRKLLHRLQPELEKHHLPLGRDRFFELLAEHNLLIRRRKKYTTTTQSRHRFKKYPNQTHTVSVERPEQLWVSDITYLSLRGGYCYLTLITDAYSRKIVGYRLSPTLHASACVEALEMALRTRQHPDQPLMHHSDRGIQYCSEAYTDILKKHDLQISMTENGDPYENALAERINGILKQEWSLDQTFASFEPAAKAVEKAIYYYNHARPHASCDYLTPVQAHAQTGPLKKRWKPRVKERLIPDSPVKPKADVARSCQVQSGLSLNL